MNGQFKVEEDLLFFIFFEDKKKENLDIKLIFKNGIDKFLIEGKKMLFGSYYLNRFLRIFFFLSGVC